MTVSDKTVRLIKSLDFLSPQIGFEYNGSSQYKSAVGGIYSLIIVGLTLVTAILFSIDVVSRNDPIVISYQDYVPSSTVWGKNYPITLTFYSMWLDDSFIDYFNITLTRVHLTENAQVIITPYDSFIEKCDLSKYQLQDEVVRKDFYYTQFPGVFCIKPFDDLEFSNDFQVGNSTDLIISISYCNPIYSAKCPKNIEDIIPSMNVGLQFLSSFSNSQNYTHPVKYTVLNKASSLNIRLSKQVKISIINSQYISDNGWIFSDEVNIDHFEFLSEETNLMLDIEKKSRKVLEYHFTSPKITKYTKRSYLKIQDLLSNVGGFTSILIVALKYITQSHLRFNYISLIRNLAIEDLAFNKESPSKNNKDDSSKNKIEPDVNALTIKRMKNQSSTKDTKMTKVGFSSNDINNKTEEQLPKIKTALNNNFMTKTTFDQRKKLINDNLFPDIKVTFFNYLLNYLLCNNVEINKKKMIFRNAEKLLNISAFSKMMVMQFDENEST